MLEMFGVILFGLITYTFLIVIPSMVEMFSTDEFRSAYFVHLASRHLNTLGK